MWVGKFTGKKIYDLKRYTCEYGCGYGGEYDVVANHEKTYAASTVFFFCGGEDDCAAPKVGGAMSEQDRTRSKGCKKVSSPPLGMTVRKRKI